MKCISAYCTLINLGTFVLATLLLQVQLPKSDNCIPVIYSCLYFHEFSMRSTCPTITGIQRDISIKTQSLKNGDESEMLFAFSATNDLTASSVSSVLKQWFQKCAVWSTGLDRGSSGFLVSPRNKLPVFSGKIQARSLVTVKYMWLKPH
jgi:hypothetical protein